MATAADLDRETSYRVPHGFFTSGLSENDPAVQDIANRIGEIAATVEQDYGWMLQNSLFAAEQIQARTREIADAIKGEMAPPYFEVADLNETCAQVLQTLRPVAATE